MVITKFDENYSHSDQNYHEAPVTEEMVKERLLKSIHSATTLSKDEVGMIKQPVIFSSNWAALALSWNTHPDPIKWGELATKALASYPHICERVPCGQTESLEDVLEKFEHKKLSELLLEASGLCSLKER